MNHIKFMFFLVSVWCLRQDVTNAAQTTNCSEGTYLHHRDDNSICVECPHGTFMPWKDHTATKCFDCTKTEDPTVEILISPCNRSIDADIQCVEGYFRRLARNPRDKPTCLTCRPACPEHHYQVHPCQNFSNLGCCPGENYDYVFGEGGVRMCRERPWMCKKGQYLDANLYDCKPCPENMFMPEDYHSYARCWDCQYLSKADLPPHVIIIQPCTSTQSPRYGCKEGYYMNHGMSYRGDDIRCSPCQTCDGRKYVGRQCNMYNDTVCCDKPDMAVVDGPQGVVCIEKIACKDGSYNPPACDKSCSHYCRKSERSDVSLCDHNNGTCLFGCLEDYTGARCEAILDNRCPHGKYGQNCTRCSRHCITFTDRHESPCDPINGTCVAGCNEGYTGDRCTQPVTLIPSLDGRSEAAELEERKGLNSKLLPTFPLRDTKSKGVEQERRHNENLQQEMPVLNTSRWQYDHPTTESTSVTKSTASQPPPHEYIILGIFILFTIGAITFCIYKLRKILWKCFCIPIQNMTSRNSSRRYVNVQTGLSPVPSPAAEDDDDEEHPYEILHIYTRVYPDLQVQS